MKFRISVRASDQLITYFYRSNKDRILLLRKPVFSSWKQMNLLVENLLYALLMYLLRFPASRKRIKAFSGSLLANELSPQFQIPKEWLL